MRTPSLRHKQTRTHTRIYCINVVFIHRFKTQSNALGLREDAEGEDSCCARACVCVRVCMCMHLRVRVRVRVRR